MRGLRNLNFHNSTATPKISAPTPQPQEPIVKTAPPPSFHQRLLHALRGWRRRAMIRRRALADARQLAGMSEHDLRDLGVGRSELPGLMQPAPSHCEHGRRAS